MKPWSTFFPDVLPAVVGLGLPEPTVEHQIKRAAQEFCRRTRAWRVTLDAVYTSASGREYDIELEPRSELVRLESAALDGHRIAVWRDRDGRGRFVFTSDGRTVAFSEQPGQGQQLVLTASLRPADSATGIEDALAERYSEAIARGAVARLKGDPILQQSFEGECDRIKVALWRGNAPINPRVRAQWF
ncbi:hypothetical protein [Xenophilus sp. Marseille-Q4582]|uniref:hypothetical protein n=1 Tax=Xenophilus sp. Marseille-Q4582 TaxID=2866600 RepID=UPI001CE44E05|nr:hypothetical protein [Xenophilus sp. Marseille-Q4582]